MALDPTIELEKLQDEPFDAVEWNKARSDAALKKREAQEHAGHASNGHGIGIISNRNEEAHAAALKSGQGRVSPGTVMREQQAFQQFMTPSYESLDPYSTYPGYQDAFYTDPSYWSIYDFGDEDFGIDWDGNYSTGQAALDSIAGLEVIEDENGDQVVVNGNGQEITPEHIALVEQEAQACVIPPGGGFPDLMADGFDNHYTEAQRQFDVHKSAIESGEAQWGNLPPSIQQAISDEYARTNGISADEARTHFQENGLNNPADTQTIQTALDKYEYTNITGMQNMHRLQNLAPLPPLPKTDIPVAQATQTDRVVGSTDPALIESDIKTSDAFGAAATQTATPGHDFQNAKPAPSADQTADTTAPATAPQTDIQYQQASLSASAAF